MPEQHAYVPYGAVQIKVINEVDKGLADVVVYEVRDADLVSGAQFNLDARCYRRKVIDWILYALWLGWRFGKAYIRRFDVTQKLR